MPLSAPAPPNKRKKVNKIITDLSHITQDDNESDPEASEFDLGTKIKTPKDVMLEELSLLNNKGSKMFRMRQQRVERFIISDESLQNFENLVPSLGCEVMFPPTPPPKPVVDEEAMKAELERKRQEYIQTYVSPWERAMKGDQTLTATMRACMPGPYIHKDLPLFKSFNRTALPYGGFEKGNRLLTFEAPEIRLAPEEPEPLPSLQADIRSRPSFNRTPIGWVCSEDCTHTPLELDTIPFDGETDDL
ncbi:myozenin-1b [Osmerus eperlanus]|uniref:myozenin-1b n=1 Tax=Osmerus eperlanus TaxID=29151 RepID=UPI002E136FC1